MAGEGFSYLNISRDVTGPKTDRRVWLLCDECAVEAGFDLPSPE